MEERRSHVSCSCLFTVRLDESHSRMEPSQLQEYGCWLGGGGGGGGVHHVLEARVSSLARPSRSSSLFFAINISLVLAWQQLMSKYGRYIVQKCPPNQITMWHSTLWKNCSIGRYTFRGHRHVLIYVFHSADVSCSFWTETSSPSSLIFLKADWSAEGN